MTTDEMIVKMVGHLDPTISNLQAIRQVRKHMNMDTWHALPSTSRKTILRYIIERHGENFIDSAMAHGGKPRS